MSTVKKVEGIAYREALPESTVQRPVDVLMLHGYPTSSYLWRNLLPPVAAAGYRAFAPDLPGFGDSEPDLPGTWERQVEHVERFHQALGLRKVVLVVHDWGGLIGLRWACDYPEHIAGLIITDTGFFADAKWHNLAKVLRTEGKGEDLINQMTYSTFLVILRQVCPKIEESTVKEYWKTLATPDRHSSQLDLYRSGDFEKLTPYQGRLAALGVPTTVIWGAEDKFVPVAGGYRFRKEIPGAELHVLEGIGHFLMEEEPKLVADRAVEFLENSFA